MAAAQHRRAQDAIKHAIDAVDRSIFVTASDPDRVAGYSIPSQAVVRQILELFTIEPGCNVLHIGPGAGYFTAILSRLSHTVTAVERQPDLYKQTRQRFQQLALDNIELRQGDGTEGAADRGPFELIIVSTPTLTDYSQLLSQLCCGGRLITLRREGDYCQQLVEHCRHEGDHYSQRNLGTIDFSIDTSQIIIDMGMLDNAALNNARQTAHDSGTLLMAELRKIVERQDIEACQDQARDHGLDQGNIEQLLKQAEPTLFDSFSRSFLDYNRLIPLYEKDRTLFVATDNAKAATDDLLKGQPYNDIEKVLLTPTDFKRLWSVLDLYLHSKSQELAQDSAIKTTATAGTDSDLLDENQNTLQPHLITQYYALLLDAVGKSASDIHLEQYKSGLRVRLRVDGDLQEVHQYSLNKAEIAGLINVIKLRGDINISERRLPQNGRSQVHIGGMCYDLRIQTQPSLHGEHVIIRLLKQSGESITIEGLGFSKSTADSYSRLLNNPVGLVLVVGPTGSGKSTTLYAGLQLLANDGRRKVITVEDPIEYSIDNIQQTRVRPEIGHNFADAMRAFVRQDPDVIMVGEIRDQETALEAMRASQTGHVVLSTLHCNDAIDALQRLYDLDIQANSIAGELLAVIAQRLAKRICEHCRQPAEADEKILNELFPDGAPKSFRCYAGQGCQHCNGSGNKGRVAVIEYLQVNTAIRHAISKRPPIVTLRKIALDSGLVTMRDSALDHVLQGVIPLDELPRILPAERMAPESRGALDDWTHSHE